MPQVLEDCFVVYVRGLFRKEPETAERVVARCPTQVEAQRIQQEHLRAGREAVVRFEGVTGGGD
jgi:hypothetical protein